MDQKVAIFDIDETIINADSMILFLLYGMKKKPITICNVILVVLYTVLYKIGIISLERAKEPFFLAVKYLTEDDLKRFYFEQLKPRIYQDALNELKKKKDEGCYVLLVTASPYAYMKLFSTIPYVDAVLGTNLVMEDGRYINKIEGLNCKGEEKVCRIQAHLKEKGIKIDFDHSFAYSDSLTDRPMFSLVKNKYLINKKYPGLEDLTWK